MVDCRPVAVVHDQVSFRRLAARGMALLALALAVASPAAAADIHGKVIGIADGDTLTVVDEHGASHKLRLDAIDAPERSQPFGQRARQSLAELAFGRAMQATCPKVDRYRRAVCRVTVEGVDVGLEQVRRGLAWHYTRYAHEQPAALRAGYAQAETTARAARSGIWSITEPVAPWDYRRAQRGG